MVWFWYFVIYSFLGCILETVYALISRRCLESRKCHFLLPICPVYGAGAVAVIFLAAPLAASPLFIFLAGAIICTVVEYLASLFYEKVLFVEFWSYAGSKFNIGGRVCLSFSAAWGAAALFLVYVLHPLISFVADQIPSPVSIIMLCLFAVDIAISFPLLRQAKDKNCLAFFSPIQLGRIKEESTNQ